MTKPNDQNDKSSESATKMYKLLGTKKLGEKVDRILIEGTSHEPKVYIDSVNAAPLTEEQHKKFTDMGYKLGVVPDEKSVQSSDKPKTPVQQQAVQAAGTGSPLLSESK